MKQDPRHAGNVVLLRGACLWLLAALVLAWCLVGLDFGVPFVKAIFPGKFLRVLQAHLDFLIMRRNAWKLLSRRFTIRIFMNFARLRWP